MHFWATRPILLDRVTYVATCMYMAMREPNENNACYIPTYIDISICDVDI